MTDDSTYAPAMAVLSAAEHIARLAGFTGALETLPQWVANQIDAARAATLLNAQNEAELRDLRAAVATGEGLVAELQRERNDARTTLALIADELDAEPAGALHAVDVLVAERELFLADRDRAEKLVTARDVEIAALKASKVFVEAERDELRRQLRELHRKHLED